MKITCISIFVFFISMSLSAKNEIDSLFSVLDKTQAERAVYIEKKESEIRSLKLKLKKKNTQEEEYQINQAIIDEYQSYLCDSAVTYITNNIRIAESQNNYNYLYESKIRLAFVYSLSGLFVQASEILDPIEFEKLDHISRVAYCWCKLRYFENLIKYTDDHRFSQEYSSKYELYRDTLMGVLPAESAYYEKEKAFLLQKEGSYDEAYEILYRIFEEEEPATHQYAMAAMSLARLYQSMGNKELENKYLLLASITDTKLAVKENEALLALAINVYKEGNTNRAYRYIKIALEDANFYNSRFRNTVIAKVQPIIEESYLLRIKHQSRNLWIYSILISVFLIALAITMIFLYKQIKIVSRARKNLKVMNAKLEKLNAKLDEANLIKEEYIGYFMNQCGVYIEKLDEYRKNVNRKIKTGQIDDLYKITASSRSLEKEIETLYNTFDEVFLKLYPNFVEDFNALLREEERYKQRPAKLNTELRIFALIRLGITDNNQISTFLRYSLQTIYNYKSKAKGKALIDPDHFDEQVKKIGILS